MEYVKNLLIGEKVEWFTLGDISVIKVGKDCKGLKKGKFPAFGTDGVAKYVDEFMSDNPSIIIPQKSIMDKVYYTDKAHWALNTVLQAEIIDKKVDPKFVFYYLLKENLTKHCIKKGIPNITECTLKQIPLPVPPISIQNKIVEVLDNFYRLFHPSIGELTFIQK